MRKVYLTVLSIITPFLGFAKDGQKGSTSAEEVVKVEEIKDEEEKKGSFAFSGYMDTFYSANLNKPASRSNMGQSNARVFDQIPGQVQLGLVQTKVAYTNDKSEAVIDLSFGPNADLGNYGNLLSPLSEDYTGMALAIKQAYFTYNFSDKFSMTAGQFGTHIGYEIIDAPVNFNYSLSNLFNNGPFYHTGLKGTYAFSDKASLMVGVVNAVDGLNDNNRKKGLISQLFLAPAEGWNLYLNFMTSNEANDVAGKTPKASYNILDLATSYQVTENFLVGLNAAYGSQKGEFQGDKISDNAKTWGGAAGYLNYSFSSLFSIGARYEHFNNESGVRGLRNAYGEGTSVNSFTLTGNFNLADGHIMVKPEIRLDSYPKVSGAGAVQQFEDSKGDWTKNSQTTLGLALIYKF
jgi:hypothetical protein